MVVLWKYLYVSREFARYNRKPSGQVLPEVHRIFNNALQAKPTSNLYPYGYTHLLIPSFKPYSGIPQPSENYLRESLLNYILSTRKTRYCWNEFDETALLSWWRMSSSQSEREDKDKYSECACIKFNLLVVLYKTINGFDHTTHF